MIEITLPNGKVLKYEESPSGFKIAKDISISLSKKAIAMKVDDVLTDLSTILSQNASVKIITPEDTDGLEVLRHDAAHVLAQSIKRLYPDTQVIIGPVIENGFYYDLLPASPFSEQDLPKIEAEMKKICAEALPISKETWDREYAIDFFTKIGESFKTKIIQDIPLDQQITVYKQGEFVDLCRGPHSPSTAFCKHLKLMKTSGSYWMGDSKNIQLQRIYGTAWPTAESLESYLTMLEQAEKRDHRIIGKQLDLFHLQDEAPGAVFWHDHGYTLYRILENYIRNKLRQNGYIEVKTPILLDKSLWEKSGHWEKFRENMFITEESENKTMAVKPMNCPCHVEIFKNNLKSYRDLPLRMAEFGCCHRNEPSGSLHGIMRVRGFTQDDAHIFCTEEQISDETHKFIKLLTEIYNELGFTNICVKFSDRPAKRAGSDEVWDHAEQVLEQALKTSGIPYQINKGEGAFYGPKLEFILKDTIGRDWQCGTFQVDYVLPSRLGATYVDKNGKKATPVMLHRAILGSLERFIGILIENYEGKFPFWLAPVQIAILPITDSVEDYGQKLLDNLKTRNIRAILDMSNEKIDYKIRKHSLMKVPLLAIIGKKEQENSTVTLRTLGKSEQIQYDEIEFYNYVSQLK